MLIGKPDPREGDDKIETLLEQLRQRQLSTEQVETYDRQRIAAEKRRMLLEAEAHADMQTKLTNARVNVQVAESHGEAELALARKKAEQTVVVADAELARSRREAEQTVVLAEAERQARSARRPRPVAADCPGTSDGVAATSAAVGDVLRGVGNDSEEERGRNTGGELGDDVDGPLRPDHVSAHDLLDDHRAGGAGRVDRGAGRRRDRDDRGEDDHADGQAGPAGRGLAIDHAEDGEDQQERADELGEGRLVPRHRVGVRRDAEPDVAGLGAEHAHDREGAGDRAEHLGGDVARDVGPGNLPVAASPKVTAGLMWLPPM